MEDQLISFETAKLAKEKGFDEECNFVFELGYDLPQRLNYYEGDGNGYIQNSKLKDNSTGNDDYQCIAPTQSLLQRWLREKHNTHIIVEPGFNAISRTPDYYGWRVRAESNHHVSMQGCGGIGDTHEIALEQALVIALKLIKL